MCLPMYYLHLVSRFGSLVLYLSNDDIYPQPSSRFDELPDDFDPSGRPGSFDDGDPQTTNLYVGNLSPQVGFCLECTSFLFCFQLKRNL